MTLARECESCGGFLPATQKFVDLGLAVKLAGGGEEQDPLEEWHGDYCLDCVRNGSAAADLLANCQKVPRAKRRPPPRSGTHADPR